MLHCMATINNIVTPHLFYTGTYTGDAPKQINKNNAHNKSTKLTTVQRTTHITHNILKMLIKIQLNISKFIFLLNNINNVINPVNVK